MFTRPSPCSSGQAPRAPNIAPPQVGRGHGSAADSQGREFLPADRWAISNPHFLDGVAWNELTDVPLGFPAGRTNGERVRAVNMPFPAWPPSVGLAGKTEHLMIEHLEGRRLFAAGLGKGPGNGNGGGGETPALDVSLSADGVLTVSNATNVQINDYDANNPEMWYEDTIFVIDKTTGATTEVSGVTSLVVNGTAGGDTISASLYTDIGASFYGCDGADSILIGGSGNGDLTIYGNGGNDTIRVSALAMDGRNAIVEGGRGKDTFNGEPIA